MAKPVRELIADLRSYWRNFLLQSLLATASIFTVLILLGIGRIVIVASIGATAFIVFALPDKFTAQPRNVIGGHIVGACCGLLGAAVVHFLPHVNFIWHDLAFALAVGLSIFIMVVIDTEHPPASGTALGLAVEEFDLKIAAAVVAIAVVLTLLRLFFRKYLRDLA